MEAIKLIAVQHSMKFNLNFPSHCIKVAAYCPAVIGLNFIKKIAAVRAFVIYLKYFFMPILNIYTKEKKCR